MWRGQLLLHLSLPPRPSLAATPPEATIEPGDEDFLSHLLAESGDGDLRAFATLYRCVAPRLYPLALRLTPRQDEADALLIDTFLHIWTDAEGYHPTRSTAQGWMIEQLHQQAGQPPPAPGIAADSELPPPDELWPAIRARLPDDDEDSRSLRWPLILASLIGVLIGVVICLSLLLDLRPLH